MIPEPLSRLQTLLARLPGIGRRSAERIALALARDAGELRRGLLSALNDLEERVALCSRCGGVTTKEQDPCALCRDPRRESDVLCVVEDPGDILLIERAGSYRGRYFALLGRLSPMSGQTVTDPRIELLLRRIREEGIREVILALNSDVESEATVVWLAEILSQTPVAVSRLALGLPAGSAIAYSDPITLARALEGRRRLRRTP